MFEMAGQLARRVLGQSAGDDNARLELAFRLCLARRPTSAESARLRQYLDHCRTRFESDAQDESAEQLAWDRRGARADQPR